MKNIRQKKIIELIKEKIYLTQEDLQNELQKLGYDVTQSTVSRDIKELRIVKGRDEEGNYRYIINDIPSAPTQSREHFEELFKKSAKSIDYALNNVVVKCYTGMASSACVSLDELFGSRMLGSLAGDDTIIIVTKSEEDSDLLTKDLNILL